VTPLCDHRRDLAPPLKSWNSRPLSEERKEVICITTRALKRVIVPAYHSLRKTVGAPGEKNSKPQLQGHKRLKS
jgi:hypothetical protein